MEDYRYPMSREVFELWQEEWKKPMLQWFTKPPADPSARLDILMSIPDCERMNWC